MGLKTAREVTDLIKREVTPDEYKTLSLDHNGKHGKVILQISNKPLVLTFPKSPSDRRWILNWRTYFRKTYRQVKGYEG